MISIRLFVIIVCAVVISGCASVGQPAKPDFGGQGLLVIPGSLELKSIDGVAVTQSLLRPDPSYRPLAAGQRTLELAYTEFWGSSQAGELVRSDIHRVDLQVQPDTEYTLKHSDPGNRLLETREKFRENFSLWAIEEGTNARTDGAFSRTNRGLLDLIAPNEAPIRLPATPAQKNVTPADDTAVATAPTEGSVQPDELEQLKFWWQKASKQQRGEFLIWSTEAN